MSTTKAIKWERNEIYSNFKTYYLIITLVHITIYEKNKRSKWKSVIDCQLVLKSTAALRFIIKIVVQYHVRNFQSWFTDRLSFFFKLYACHLDLKKFELISFHSWPLYENYKNLRLQDIVRANYNFVLSRRPLLSGDARKSA